MCDLRVLLESRLLYEQDLPTTTMPKKEESTFKI